MRITIAPHTLLRAEERGTNDAEIRDVLATGFSISAKYGKIGKARVYEFNSTRAGRHYKQKRVEVFYVVEGNELITVTVYVFYGAWE